MAEENSAEQQVKRKRGRPKGSKNKPKNPTPSTGTTEAKAEVKTVKTETPTIAASDPAIKVVIDTTPTIGSGADVVTTDASE